MKITVHGSGYVGAVAAACFASMGNDVHCVDTNPERVAMFNAGKVPIYEPGLAAYVVAGLGRGNLRFSADPEAAVKHGDLQFVAVGTPPAEDGSADLRHVLNVADTIARHMNDPRVVIIKSTVPVGTADRVREVLTNILEERKSKLDFDVVSNPEFLKEGNAVEDFTKPERIIIGVENKKSERLLRRLYAPFTRKRDRIMVMPIRDAEFTKYAANAMLASRISVMNEFSRLAENLDVNIENVRKGIGADPRIGFQFIYPGCGYGGSCFPKDVKALIHSASAVDMKMEILSAVESVNAAQKKILFDKFYQHFDGEIEGTTVALWGLAFKPNTDDMREAPSRVLIELLVEHGVNVRAYDPGALEKARELYPSNSRLMWCEQVDETLEDVSALIIATEWAEFRSPDFELMRRKMRQPIIFDGRNIYDPGQVAEAGFTYYSIGRPTAHPVT